MYGAPNKPNGVAYTCNKPQIFYSTFYSAYCRQNLQLSRKLPHYSFLHLGMHVGSLVLSTLGNLVLSTIPLPISLCSTS